MYFLFFSTLIKILKKNVDLAPAGEISELESAFTGKFILYANNVLPPFQNQYMDHVS